MPNFALTCCSTVDLSHDDLASRDISYACFHWDLDDVDHLDDLYASITPERFFGLIAGGAQPKTSNVSIGEFLTMWEPLLADGMDILHISLSSGLSGAYSSAVAAANEAMETHPGRRVNVVDSLGASSGYGLLVQKVADLRDGGASLGEATGWAERNRLNVHHWFFSTDLTSYVRGGRISQASGFIGTALKICPLLNMNNEGKLIPREKIRTKRRCIEAIVDRMAEHAVGGTEYADLCNISMSVCPEEAKAVRDAVENRFPALAGKVVIHDIGTVIGSHTGPGTVALFFMGDERGE